MIFLASDSILPMAISLTMLDTAMAATQPNVLYFIFEILDSTTTERIEHQIGQFMKMSEVDDYSIKSTVFDSNNLKVSLKFDNNVIDFMLVRGR